VERPFRARPSGTSSALLAGGVGLFGLLALSLALQPPYDAGADGLQKLLEWARAGLLTAGAATFLIALAVSLRSDEFPLPRRSPFVLPPQRPRGTAAFTLVALGGTPDDTRAIADADDAAEAVRLLWEWSDKHPDEHVLVFNAEAEPVAFKRPAWLPSA
jgi:hypothetical protein